MRVRRSSDSAPYATSRPSTRYWLGEGDGVVLVNSDRRRRPSGAGSPPRPRRRSSPRGRGGRRTPAPSRAARMPSRSSGRARTRSCRRSPGSSPRRCCTRRTRPWSPSKRRSICTSGVTFATSEPSDASSRTQSMPSRPTGCAGEEFVGAVEHATATRRSVAVARAIRRCAAGVRAISSSRAARASGSRR